MTYLISYPTEPTQGKCGVEEEKTQIIKNWRQITVQKLLNIFTDRIVYTDRIT